ncbi:hypothetical protein JOC34_000384 [Virgibacillus halotolerans]|uniref:hypothetical protein n=1 Tax=Virgibacillus halotolerans TaxID=1071053 RepID=UPI001961E2D3|nr:hypothetical protein [Virgibacillus halotolerans]MBM7598027.1 hypothetical protein [Virgibacillus halotolerans]
MSKTIHGNYTDFPSLHAISKKAEAKRSDYVSKKEGLKNTDRYNDNETEREYQLEELEKDYDANMDAMQEEYDVEIAAIERDLAERAFSTDAGTPEEQAAAEKLIGNIGAQLATAPVSSDVFDLLADKSKVFNDAERLAMAQQIDALTEQALSRAISQQSKDDINRNADAIRQECSKVKGFQDVAEQRSRIKEIKSKTGPVGIQRMFDYVADRAQNGYAAKLK